MDEEGTAVVVDQLSKVFLPKNGQPVLAMSDVSLRVKRKEVLAILGPSGCGKSTLLRVLGGLDTQYQGTVRWESSRQERGRLNAATVFQQDSTLPWLTVAQNISLGLSGLDLSKQEKRQRIARHAELVGLGDFQDTYPHELSGGMKQRTAIARALAAEPQVLLMDEPLAALDAQTRIVMQAELSALWRRTGSTVLYVTHDIEEAITLADRIIVLSARPGRVLTERRIALHDGDDAKDPIGLRADPRFGELAKALWSDLAQEVGEALSVEKGGE